MGTIDPTEDDLLIRIAKTLATRGWHVEPDFLSEEAWRELRRHALAQHEAGAFHPAGIGRGQGLRVVPEVRGDRILWIDPNHPGPSDVSRYLDRLDQYRLELNRSLYLGLFEFECHFALYPPGGHYQKHFDQFEGVGLRTVTAILYLNEDWSERDGGQLRIYTDPDDPDSFEEVLPLGGQLVTFLSADYLHEVMPSRRERLSLTGWFKRRSGP